MFNSYYHSVGRQFPRPQRGSLSRPTVRNIFSYRRFVDEQMETLLEETEDELLPELVFLVELGCHHEQQHQELMLTDLKAAFALSPLDPMYITDPLPLASATSEKRRFELEGGLVEIGHPLSRKSDLEVFAFDNETPAHRVFLTPFAVNGALTTNGEYLEFIAAQGYERPEFWLDDGWAQVQKRGWNAPAYWEKEGSQWLVRTLYGRREIDENAPVVHVSFFEADAYARWRGARLPSEEEWEHTANQFEDAPRGIVLDDEVFHPVGREIGEIEMPVHLLGEVWEWTSSAYRPYPGFQPLSGGLGEYNGKFMSGQMVLRGGSCATPLSHLRRTYRNFFQPEKRWQFSGFRLAWDI